MRTNEPEFEDSMSNKIVKGVCFFGILVVIVFGVKFALFMTAARNAFSQNGNDLTPREREAANRRRSALPPTLRQQALSAYNRAGNSKELDDWKKAAALYVELDEENPNDGRIAFNKAYSLHAAKRYVEAIEAHKATAKLSPNKRTRTIATYNLACAYALIKEKSKSLQALQEAIDAGFVSQNGKKVKDDTDFAFLKDDPEFKRLAKLASPKIPIKRQFDFWIGTWDVYRDNGDKVGRNVITLSAKGNLLTENWTSTQGQTGTSMNFVDPEENRWKKIWIGQDGSVIRSSGEFSDGNMQFSGTAFLANGKTELRRSSFAESEDRRLRQFIERSKDNGETWTTFFKGYYAQVADDTKKE